MDSTFTLSVEQQSKLKALYGVIEEDADLLLFTDLLTVANDIIDLEFFQPFLHKIIAKYKPTNHFNLLNSYDITKFRNFFDSFPVPSHQKHEILDILYSDLSVFLEHKNPFLRHVYLAHYLPFSTKGINPDNEESSYRSAPLFKEYLINAASHKFPLTNTFNAYGVFNFLSLNIGYILSQIEKTEMTPEKENEYFLHLSDLLDAVDNYTSSKLSQSSSSISKKDLLKYNQMYQSTILFFKSGLDQLHSENSLFQKLKNLILSRGNISADQFHSLDQITHQVKPIINNEDNVLIRLNIPNTLFFSDNNVFVNNTINSRLILSVNEGLGNINPVSIFIHEINDALDKSSYNSFMFCPKIIQNSIGEPTFSSTEVSFLAPKNNSNLAIQTYKNFISIVIEMLNSNAGSSNKIQLNYSFVNETFREHYLINEINEKNNTVKNTNSKLKKI